MIPGAFEVPLSNLSGYMSGWIKEWEALPVPPCINPSRSKPSLTYKPPVPWGPSSPLCPGKAKRSIFNFSISISYTPADWAASTIYITPWFFAIMPISSIGIIVPVRFDTWVVTISFVFFLMADSMSFGLILPLLSASTMVFSIPYFPI